MAALRRAARWITGAVGGQELELVVVLLIFGGMIAIGLSVLP